MREIVVSIEHDGKRFGPVVMSPFPGRGSGFVCKCSMCGALSGWASYPHEAIDRAKSEGWAWRKADRGGQQAGYKPDLTLCQMCKGG